jgi:3-hydroxyisobutyrate dehydrogenase
MSDESRNISSPKERVGFVGLGTMGSLMAANVARAGFALTVWNRTPDKAKNVVELGANEAPSLVALAATCDVIVMCLTDSPQVEEVLFGVGGLCEGLVAGSLVIDCSTISPVRASEFGDRLSLQGVAMVDAPVSGGSEGARLGTLTIMVGGDNADVRRASTVLDAMGTTVTHMGPRGAGQWTKAVNQVILAGTYLAVAEGVTLATKAGLDVELVMRALANGAAGSWVLANRSGRMIDNEYPLGFKIALHRKDLAIGLELARAVGAVLPQLSRTASSHRGTAMTTIRRSRGQFDNCRGFNSCCNTCCGHGAEARNSVR